ncbi:hypothetical protein [Chryseobacterium sp.]|uniref:hypothetical protein n=1 Tax=Chryseobacterium sp. TaxID=1871047 RepID=UPI001B0F95B6|nr:hypothetical protein [Chryseobacterium sp.]MBO9690407.1 hypothetical protein [Chryseobacterium sp.]
MIYVVQIIIALLIICFIIFSVIDIYCKIFKKESRAFVGIVISFISLLLIEKVRSYWIKNELIEHIETSKIEQEESNFSKQELSHIEIVSERIRTVDKNIYVVLMPQKDTICLKQDFQNNNKFWIHYKKYELLMLTAPIGYIIKN